MNNLSLNLKENKKQIRRVEIVTPVYNRCDMTLQCLKSLSRINTEGLEIHIIIVDDGSTDGTSEAIEKFYPDVEIIKGDGDLWFTGGTNRGIEAALKHNPDYILTINDDEVFEENFLQYLVKCAEKYPRSIIGSLLLLWDTPHKLFQVAPKWRTLEGGYRHWVKQTIWTIPDKPWQVELIVGNCVLFPVEAIKECGLMNEKKFPHFGDSEYTPRMRKKGWKLLIEPKARVFCQPNNIPPSVQKMPIKKMFHTLFLDLGNGNSLRRRLYANLYGGPNKIEGFLAFFIFYFRYLIGKNTEGELSKTLDELSLKELYSDKILN